MKIKKIFKNFFVVYLFILVIGLYAISFISYSKTSPKEMAASLKDSVNDYDNMEYRIIKTDPVECEINDEYFYEDENYYYYFTCPKYNNIYIEWKNGENVLLDDALKTKKVTINSLISHGLGVVKAIKNEQD